MSSTDQATPWGQCIECNSCTFCSTSDNDISYQRVIKWMFSTDPIPWGSALNTNPTPSAFAIF